MANKTMKSIFGVFAMTAIIAAENDLNNQIKEKEREEREERERERKRETETLRKIERNAANGLKEFFYGENSVWAINKKNADRKARNNHWL
jgi:hypothetical protein